MSEFIKRAMKYLLIGMVVAIASILIPRKKLDVEEIIMLSLIGATCLALLDLVIPQNRFLDGASFGLGLKFIGFGL